VKAKRLGAFAIAATLALVLMGLPACSHVTAEDVCEAVGECDLGVPADCVGDGELLEERAERAGCEEPLDAYLECLYDSPCAWRVACGPERDQLELCVGAFPS
jgi:hypothetical protein